jgi:hypothetical protein
MDPKAADNAPEALPTKTWQDRLLRYLPFFTIGHLMLTIPTVVLSLALAYFTFVQADATRKIQQSETWPYVSFGTGNANTEGKSEITLNLSNNGVGPARIQAMELTYKGKPMPNPREFLKQCCAWDSKFTFMSEPVTGVLRPGQQSNFIRLPKTDANATIWDNLNAERWKIVVRICYCSIFDDCWISDNRKKAPVAVKQCPASWATFDERPFAGTAGASEAGF